MKTLTRPLVGKFHHVFMDNFFTSPALFTDLFQDRIYACGTVRSNMRDFPQDLKGKRMLKNRYAHINSLIQMLTQFKDTFVHPTYICTSHIQNSTPYLVVLHAGVSVQFGSVAS